MTPTNGLPNKSDSVKDNVNNNGEVKAFSVQHREMILRFSNSLDEKKKFFDRHYPESVADSSLNIIAISGCELYDRYSEDFSCPNILKAVYPIGNLTVRINVETRDIENEFYAYEPQIGKSNKSPVQKDFFMSDKNQNIAGIIYSFTDIWNLKGMNSIGNDLIYIGNLYSNKIFNPKSIGINNIYLPILENGYLTFKKDFT
jgi:hypothetical protein